jgi:[ribosomal protein S5]-alanine N-acetyltransferase
VTSGGERPEALVGTGVTLRRVGPDDAADLLEVSVYDGIWAGDLGDARAHLARIADDEARGESVHWGIVPSSTGPVVGTIGFYRGFADGRGEVGYVLRPSFRGRGTMREVLALVLADGFVRLGLRAVVAYTEPSNAPSVALLRRAGFIVAPDDPGRYELSRALWADGGSAPGNG